MATAAQHVTSLASMNHDVAAWVDEVAKLTQPDKIHWCDGSEAEFESSSVSWSRQGVAAAQSAELSGLLSVPLAPLRCGARRAPDLRLHRESRGRRSQQQLDGAAAGARQDGRPVRRLHAGAHAYVVPYCMGPIDSPFSRCGVEITDSAYVVLNMAS